MFYMEPSNGRVAPVFLQS